MKKKLLHLLLVILLLVSIPGSLLLASDISGALYRMSIVASNNGTLANYVSTNGVISTPNLISGGFLNSSANNCAVLDAADSDVLFMPGYLTNPWAFWVETIGADSYINYDLYTADTTGGDIAYFPDTTGMIVSDNSTIELGSDFEVNTEGWVDAVTSANKSLVYKQDAFETYISADDEITSSIDWGAQFPFVEAVNGGNDVVNQLNHTVNLPAGIVAGDLLIIYFAADGNPLITFPNEGTDWIQLFEDGRVPDVKFAAAYRIADGTEGATVTVATDANEMTAHTTYRIRDYSDVPVVGVKVDGNTNIPDPPNLVATYGAENTLWMALCAYDANKTVNVYPANYTDGRNDLANNAEGCGVGTARRELNAAAENPGAFTLSGADEWVANTLLIAPAPLEVTALSIASDEYTVKTYGVANEPVWATGDVLHFDGAANSNVNATAIHNNIPDLWVSSWFKLDSTFSAASPTDQFVWGKFNGAGDYVYAYLESDDGMLYFQFDDGVNPFSLTSTTVSWTGDTWYHTINSLDNTPTQRLLVNGVAEDTDTVVASNTPNGGDFCFGDFDDPGAVTGFIGEIQNVIVGTDDLTPAEEAALYAGTAPGDENNYWYVDEGIGLITFDYGSDGNDGAIDNAPTWETSTFTTGSTGRLCDFYIEVDDGVTDPDRWGTNLKGASVPDNGNDWEFFLNDAMPYVYSDRITVGGVLHAWHEWEYDNIFHDRSYYGLELNKVNQWINVADSASLKTGTGDYTLAVWFNQSSDTGAATHDGLVSKGTIGTNGGYTLYIHKAGNHISWYSDAQLAGGIAFGLNDDIWHYVVAAKVGDVHTIYIDNVVDDTNTLVGVDIDAVTAVTLGKRSDGNYLRGSLDNIEIYSRGLLPDEIEYNWNGGVGRYTSYSTTGLIGQWHIEEGDGAATADTSGEGNNGTLMNAPTWVNGKVPRPAGSSGTNDATPSFRTASSDADVVATAVSFQPVEEAKAPPWSLTETVATWITAANVVGNFTTTPSPTYPGASVIEDISAASGTPAQLPFIIIFGFITLAISFCVSYVLRQHGSRSLLVKVIIIGGLMGIWRAVGVFDFWMIVFFLIIGLAIMAASKPGEAI